MLLLLSVFVGFHVNGTSNVMQTPVISSNNVAFTTAIGVGIVFGIVTTFILIISIIVLRCRRYWKLVKYVCWFWHWRTSVKKALCLILAVVW